MATGNSTPVNTTRNNEIPSTPSFQPMPNSLIQFEDSTNWKSPSACWNFTSRYTDKAPVMADMSTASWRVVSGRCRETSATSRAPTAGTTIKVVNR